MKKLTFVPAIAGLALTASLLAPSPAGADPFVTGTVGEVEVPTEGGLGWVGQSLVVHGQDCIDPVTQAPGLWGQYLSTTGDPWTSEDASHSFETEGDGNGGFDIVSTITPDTPTGLVRTRLYCATAPVSSLHDPQVLWVAPQIQFEIKDGAQPNGMRTALRSAQTSSAPTVSIRVDPDSLPAVDKINIPGAQAAKLKKKVDAAAKTALALKQRSFRAKHRPGTSMPLALTSQEYVNTAYATLTGRVPSTKVSKPFVDRLAGGQLKVAVVEDIALTAHNAAWWITKA